MIDLTDVTLTVADLIPPHCPWGLRHFWRQHGLDFADFLQNGVSAEVIWATGDGLARAAVTRKLEALSGQ